MRGNRSNQTSPPLLTKIICLWETGKDDQHRYAHHKDVTHAVARAGNGRLMAMDKVVGCGGVDDHR